MSNSEAFSSKSFKGLAPDEIKKARRAAIQLMYQFEINSLLTFRADIFAAFCQQNEIDDRIQPQLRMWMELCLEDLERIDALIAKKSRNWTIDRMGRVDLSILRVCLCELLNRQDVKSSIVMAEAAEIAKEFGSEHSQAFVHGILDAVYKELVSSSKE